MANILALDGGGTWSLLQARALAALYPGERGHQILSRFDYAFATSGGSIVLGGLLKDMAPVDIVGQFADSKVRNALYRKSPLVLGWVLRHFGAGARYSTLAKRDALHAIFGTQLLESLPHPDNKQTRIVIVAFDYDRSRAFFFRSESSPGFPTVRNVTIADAVHASTTAPVLYYDRPAQVLVDMRYPGSDTLPVTMQFWDGGVAGLNNPVAAAVAEAITARVAPGDIAVLSLGSGSVLRSNNPNHHGDNDQRARPGHPSTLGDLKRLAEAVVDDPPDFASFVAHAMTGGSAPMGTETISDGRVVRMSPLVLGEFRHGSWRRPVWNELPARLGSPDLFSRLQNLGLDAVKPQQVDDIGKLGDAWLADRAPNQPIRGNFFQDAVNGYHAEIGQLTFSAAREAAAKLGLL